MLDIEANDEDYKISGFISLPEIHRSNRNGIVTIVNGRVVRNSELNKAINDSYHSYKPDTRYPIVVINIELDPSLVDVNIHPTKMDIKFSKLEELISLISNTIRDRIKNINLIPHIEEQEEIVANDDLIDLTDLKEKYDQQMLLFETIKEENKEYIKEEETIFDEIKEEETEYLEKKFPDLSIVGVVNGTYIVCQNEDGMYLIDQHAAKERVNYEFYLKKLGEPNLEVTPMLFPLTLEYPVNEYIVIREHFETLTNMGFNIEEFGINSVIIKAHPTWLPKGYENEAIKHILEAIVTFENKFSIEKFNESVATMMSCKLAIKANQYVSTEELEQLIIDLKNCHNPFNCPHGRPTIVFHSNYDLEKMFKRSGF